jgi:hypothetical protein
MFYFSIYVLNWNQFGIDLSSPFSKYLNFPLSTNFYGIRTLNDLTDKLLGSVQRGPSVRTVKAQLGAFRVRRTTSYRSKKLEIGDLYIIN